MIKRFLPLLVIAALAAGLTPASPAGAQRRGPRVVPGKETRAPSFVTGTRDAARTGSAAAVARAHLKANGGRYRIADPARDLEVVEVIESDGTETVRFSQKHKRVPVFGAQYLVHMDRSGAGRAVESVNGHYFTDLEAPVTPRIDAAAATELARRRARMKIAKVEKHGLTVLPPVLPGGDALTYHFTVWGERFGVPAKQEMFINALTGAQQLAYNNLQHNHGNVTIGGRTFDNKTYGGRNIKIRAVHRQGRFELRDRKTIGPKKHITTHNVKGRFSYVGRAGNIAKAKKKPFPDRSAVHAHDGARRVYQYFKALGWNSLNNKKKPIKSSVHYSEGFGPYCNAFWDGNQVVYGDCGPPKQVHPLTADLDVIAHELTHGVTQFTAGLVYLNQSGAMNEAYSDYFGNAIDVDHSGMAMSHPKSGHIGEDICKVAKPANWECPLRDLNDKRTTDEYIHFLADYDNGGVHLNSTIYGGALWEIRKTIPKRAADRYIFRALRARHTALDDFVAGRAAVIAAATDLGAPPDHLAKIEKAFDDKKIKPGWETQGQTGDGTVLREDVFPFGFMAAPPQASGGRYVLGDYQNKRRIFDHPQQIFVGNVNNPSEEARRVGDHALKATLTDDTPDISGNRVIWSHLFMNRGSLDANVRQRELGPPDGAATNLVSNNKGFQWFASIDGDLVAWEDTRRGDTNIWAKRLGGPAVPITSGNGEEWLPQVSGDWIAWWDVGDFDRLPRIGLYNFETEDRRTIPPNGAALGPPGLGGGYVYWYEDTGGSDHGAVMRSPLSGTGRQTVVPEDSPRAPFWGGFTSSMPLVSANQSWIVYTTEFGYRPPFNTSWPREGRDVIRVDVSGGGPTFPDPELVTTNRGDQAYPTLVDASSETVLWLDGSRGQTDLMRKP